jgi:5-oxoprolinase (ATP-hydrolysing)
MKFVARGDTTVVDAYLSAPSCAATSDQVAAQMPGVPLHFMQSSGGLTEAHALPGQGRHPLGPAGGIVGMVRTAAAAGHERVIGFDMGGTSTDVSHYAGEYERAFETQVAGVRMRAPMMSIHTVAAGGGSILRFDGARLRVGPESAGANPGPASYRRGGPLAVTDANVMLGACSRPGFPKVFGPKGDEALDREGVVARFEATGRRGARPPPGGPPRPRGAGGRLPAASPSQNMANAIKRISVARGYDVTRYTLQCFGGAGGQHACAVADALGHDARVHPPAGRRAVGLRHGPGRPDRHARGLGGARNRRGGPGRGARRVRGRWPRRPRRAASQQGFAASAHRAASAQYTCATRARTPRSWSPLARSGRGRRPAFEAAYRQRFAFLMPGRPLVIEAVSVEAVGPGERRDAGRGRRRAARQRRRLPTACACTWSPTTGRRAGVDAAAVACASAWPGRRVHRRAGGRSPSATPPPWWSRAGRRDVRAGGALELVRVRRAPCATPRSAPRPTR